MLKAEKLKMKRRQQKPSKNQPKLKRKRKKLPPPLQQVVMRTKSMMFMPMNQNKRIHLLICLNQHLIWMNLNVFIPMKIQRKKHYHIFGRISIANICPSGFANINIRMN
jgi:hypothetical protein